MERPGRPLSLLHLVNARSANVGNGALTEGTESILSDDLAESIAWQREPWDDYTFGLKQFDRRFVDLVNASDGMIVGGAVAFNGRRFYSNAGMRFDLPLELWNEFRRPLVFYGLSYRHWAGEIYHHADRLRASLRCLLERDNILLALRNDGTREWLASTLRYEDERIKVIPDPAVFVPAMESGDYHELEEGRPNIILSLNDEDSNLRYGSAEVRARVLSGIAKAMECLLTRWDARLIIAPHYFDDCRIIADFIDCCRPQLAHQRMILTGLAGLRGTRHFYGRYRRADLAISMRVHSMSPCIGLGIPMIALVTQDRMTAFLMDAGLSDCIVDAFATDLAERLSDAIDRTLTRSNEVRRRFAHSANRMRERSQAFNASVQSLFMEC
jgi:Polysaccharide pyruvyl transferase